MGGQGWGPLGLGARGLKAGGFIRRTHLLPALQQGAFAGSLPLLLLAERFTTDHSQPKPQVASVSRPQLGVGLTSCLTGSPVPFTLVTQARHALLPPSLSKGTPTPLARAALSLGEGDELWLPLSLTPCTEAWVPLPPASCPHCAIAHPTPCLL